MEFRFSVGGNVPPHPSGTWAMWAYGEAGEWLAGGAHVDGTWYSFDVPVPAGAGSLRLDDLWSWYVRLRDGMDAAAFVVGWQGPVAGRDKLSASLRIDGPERLGELTVWETGEAQLQLGDVATGVVNDQVLRLTDAAHLAVVVSAMRQWGEGAQT